MSARKKWSLVIAEARSRGRFTRWAKISAAEWATCAVGEHSAKEKARLTEYFEDGGEFPIFMSEIWDLGDKFSDAVLDDAIEEAQRLYDAIQVWFAKAGELS